MDEGQTKASLVYYATQGPITDPGDYSELFDDLPKDVGRLCRLLQGLMMHRESAPLRGVELSEDKKEEANLRYVSKLMQRIIELDSSPLNVARPPEKRLSITCRDFSVMLCSILRHHRIPARSRCGYAIYFSKSKEGFYYDHWVTEFWDADDQRWVMVDAEIDDIEKEKYCKVEVDTLDIPSDLFLLAGKAWQLYRNGVEKPEHFGEPESPNHGEILLRKQLTLDFASLNKYELLPWEMWCPNDIGFLDNLASLTLVCDKSFGKIRSTFDSFEQKD